jgi:glycosyltransferase involved in cell wall biosynthesis
LKHDHRKIIDLPKVLVVSSFFPPHHSAGGSIRLVKFIKYLTEWGWQFTVYSRTLSDVNQENDALSEFLLEELPENIIVNRYTSLFSTDKSNRIKKWIANIAHHAFGDSSLGWGINAFWKGLTEVKKYDLIFSVTPPFTNALIALLLSWAGKKSLVLDLKDDWVGSPTFMRKNSLRRRVETFLEELIIRGSSAVIAVTDKSYKLYKERYAHVNKGKNIYFVPNGCDLDEYHHLEQLERSILSDRFLILSAAWGFRKDYRDITLFLLALDLFFQRHPDAKNETEVILLGNSLSAEYDKLLSDLNLRSVIKCIGALHRDQLVMELWRADLLLLVQPVGNTTAISGTLYEYWATGKAPVMLISDKGASSEFVLNNRLGRHFKFDELEGIASYIEHVFKAYKERQPIWIDRMGIQAYDRKLLAKQMDEIWRKIVART